jgi:hypothetical protein
MFGWTRRPPSWYSNYNNCLKFHLDLRDENQDCIPTATVISKSAAKSSGIALFNKIMYVLIYKVYSLKYLNNNYLKVHFLWFTLRHGLWYSINKFQRSVRTTIAHTANVSGYKILISVLGQYPQKYSLKIHACPFIFVSIVATKLYESITSLSAAEPY